MSKMIANRKPPLPNSPNRLRPRCILRSNSTALQTPSGLLTNSEKPIHTWKVEEFEIQPEYRSISIELEKIVELGGGELKTTLRGVISAPLFERGRFYDEYSARRKERLRRKKGEAADELKTPYRLGVTVESSKRRDSKKLESLRKTAVAAAYSAGRSVNPRYSLRSMSKENKKPPLNTENSGITKIGARGGRRI